MAAALPRCRAAALPRCRACEECALQAFCLELVPASVDRAAKRSGVVRRNGIDPSTSSLRIDAQRFGWLLGLLLGIPSVLQAASARGIS